MEFFEMRVFFGQINNFKIKQKNFANLEVSRDTIQVV